MVTGLEFPLQTTIKHTLIKVTCPTTLCSQMLSYYTLQGQGDVRITWSSPSTSRLCTQYNPVMSWHHKTRHFVLVCLGTCTKFRLEDASYPKKWCPKLFPLFSSWETGLVLLVRIEGQVTAVPSIIITCCKKGLITSPSIDQPTNGKKMSRTV